MTPALLNALVIEPVLTYLDWPQRRERAVLLTAIAGQESGLRHRRQMPSGPAMSYWQIELATALDCCGRSAPVQDLCIAIDQGYGTNDHAACAIAAGILRLTPGSLPEIWEAEAAWQYYLKAWRPGKPRPYSWPAVYAAAMEAVIGMTPGKLPEAEAAWLDYLDHSRSGGDRDDLGPK